MNTKWIIDAKFTVTEQPAPVPISSKLGKSFAQSAKCNKLSLYNITQFNPFNPDCLAGSARIP